MLSKSSLAFTIALGRSRRTFIPITDLEIFLFASCLDWCFSFLLTFPFFIFGKVQVFSKIQICIWWYHPVIDWKFAYFVKTCGVKYYHKKTGRYRFWADLLHKWSFKGMTDTHKYGSKMPCHIILINFPWATSNNFFMMEKSKFT